MPDYEEMMGKKDQTADEMRKEMKKEGRLPPRTFDVRPINIASTGMGYLPYIILNVRIQKNLKKNVSTSLQFG